MSHARYQRESRLGPLSDLEDLRGTIPPLDEDFHHPCPGCGKELVIRVEARLRRVRCGQCHEEYTLDKRIGGELTLLRSNTKEYAWQRAFVRRVKAIKLRVVTIFVGFLIVGSFIGAITFHPALGIGAVVVFVICLYRADHRTRDLREEHKDRQHPSPRRRRHRHPRRHRHRHPRSHRSRKRDAE